AGGQQVCTFEPGSALAVTGGDTNKVGYYYHEDNLNSSSALSDSSHNQIEVNAFYPFGRVQTASPQAGFKVSRQFTGQIKDDETGLYYFNARYYDPELGRFTQPDTIIPDFSNPQSYNRYSYCVNNPLRYTDPSGHFAFMVPVYLAGAALTTYAVDHLYWNARIAASQVSASQNIDRMVQAHGYVNYAEFAAAHQTPSHPAQAGSPQQVQAAAALGVAGADAVLTAGTMITPELRGTTLLSSEEKLYRGVPGNGTEKANLGAQGIAKPRGTALDPKSLENHVMGADANAGVTSWTTDRNVAKSFSGNEGTVIEVNKSAVANQVVPRPPVQKYGAEKEVLLKGTIQGKPTTP
ncbi:MAG: RHS repeat-associated core domain-containing protein, partial [Verrucomicrobiota bacterium]